ncbi:hypothetical protein CEP52_008077 [Fusarium oligoseptatum]|uniref:Uncharacterized protein n=1 Tax=Fusarium oligoseptatum TaxID=2604345 RepID=A0A428TJS2_9HYPO|nr:hypothetical protein CEP52_008077 [Fusarium oligoseptatum]
MPQPSLTLAGPFFKDMPLDTTIDTSSDFGPDVSLAEVLQSLIFDPTPYKPFLHTIAERNRMRMRLAQSLSTPQESLDFSPETGLLIWEGMSNEIAEAVEKVRGLSSNPSGPEIQLRHPNSPLSYHPRRRPVAASTATFPDSFKPDLLIVDKAATMREITTLIPIDFFDPKAWIITGLSLHRGTKRKREEVYEEELMEGD